MTKTLAGGLILLEDSKPLLGFGELIEEAISWVDPTYWPRLLRAPVTLMVVDSIAKPIWAEGKWSGSSRTARVKRLYREGGKPKANRVRYTALHEAAGHGSDEDVLGKAKRQGIMELMDPRPDSWSDVDGLEGMRAYWRLPPECYANRMVEALTAGRVTSPFDDDYTRTIPNAKLNELLNRAMLPAPAAPEPPTVEPPAMPPPTTRELELMANLEQCHTERESYEADALEAVRTLWLEEWGPTP